MKLSKILENYHDKIKGGKGDETSPYDADLNQLIVGIFVEFEHTTDVNIAISIALDHLTEHNDYYTMLIKSGLVDEKKALYYAHKLLKI
jgi:hypothetical protein